MLLGERREAVAESVRVLLRGLAVGLLPVCEELADGDGEAPEAVGVMDGEQEKEGRDWEGDRERVMDEQEKVAVGREREAVRVGVGVGVPLGDTDGAEAEQDRERLQLMDGVPVAEWVVGDGVSVLEKLRSRL